MENRKLYDKKKKEKNLVFAINNNQKVDLASILLTQLTAVCIFILRFL